MAKSDFSAAFRHVPCSRDSWPWLVMKAICPLDGKTYFFVDKCLPFGSSISCAHFQAISDGIAAVVSYRIKKPVLNYLDDFFFAVLWKFLCDRQVEDFIEVCKQINFPVAMDKIFWGTNFSHFSGYYWTHNINWYVFPLIKLAEPWR